MAQQNARSKSSAHVSGDERIELSRSPGPVSNTRMRPWSPTWGELCDTLSKPKIGMKDGSYFLAGPCNGARSNEHMAGVNILILDGDSRVDPETGEVQNGAPPAADVHAALEALGIQHLVYTSHSHLNEGPGFHRWRVVLPQRFEDVQELQAAGDWLLEQLHARGALLAQAGENLVMAQPWFLPRVPAEREADFEFYRHDGDGRGSGLPMDEIRERAARLREADKTLLQAAAKATKGRDDTLPGGLIGRYLEIHNTAEAISGLLLEAGYTPRGQGVKLNGAPTFRFLAPGSESGNPGVVLFRTQAGRWRVYSNHGAHDPLGADKSGHRLAHDAYEVFTRLQHDGDADKALEAWTRQALADGLWAWNTPAPMDRFPHVKCRTNKEGETVITGLRATLENTEFMTRAYGIRVQYNLVTKLPELAGERITGDGRGDGEQDAAITRVESQAALCGLPTLKIPQHLGAIALRHPTNPVTDYLAGLAWDGQPHLQALVETIQVPESMEPARDIVVRLWMIQACAAADAAERTPNRYALPKYESVLIFRGRQGCRKGDWLRGFLPEPLRQYFKEGANLNPADRDSVMKAVGHWINELGELDATFRRADLSALKAFLSEQHDTFRVPYGRTHNRYRRRTVFVGSVNEETFLRDRTGNRRYWPLMVQGLTLPADAGVDVDQAWAEAWHLYTTGAQWWPTPEQEDVIAEARLPFEEGHGTEIAERVLDYFGEFTEENKAVGSRMSALEICQAIGEHRPGQVQYAALKNFLEKHNVDRDGMPDRVNNHGTFRWRMPATRDLLTLLE